MPAGAEDVFDVAYTFPDGHTEHATKATDDQGRTWWRMIYTYDDGGGNEMEKPEIEVTMSLSGVQRQLHARVGRGHLRAGQPRLLSRQSPRSSASCSTSVA